MSGDVMIEMKGKIFNQLEIIELDEIKSKEKKIPLLILRYDEQDVSSSLKSFILKYKKSKPQTRDELNEF